MSEITPTPDATIASVASSKPSRWIWLGPLLVVTVVAGWASWKEWKGYRFEKERTETPPHVVEDLKLKLLWIPAGTFVIGTDEPTAWVEELKKKYNNVKPSGWSERKLVEVTNEMPATVVTLTNGFYLGETEVTQAQWETLMGNNPSGSEGLNRPVEKISWDLAVEYCKKLTERERAAGRIGPKQAFRLPTEAEWEYACRAGNRGQWCFGNDQTKLSEFGWFEDNAKNSTQDVAQKHPNDWGLFDMHGNVWEWCSDWFGPYPGGKVDDPMGPLSGTGRVNRGGSAHSRIGNCRASKRDEVSQFNRVSILGFRIVLSPAP